MKQYKRHIKIICILLVFVLLNSLTSFASPGNNLRAAGTKGFSQIYTKTLSHSSLGKTVNIEYCIKGNYTYDLNSGAILSAYNTKLDYVIMTNSVDDQTYRYDIDVKNIVLGPATISGDGSRADFPVRFQVYLNSYISTILYASYDLGTIRTTATVYAE